MRNILLVAVLAVAVVVGGTTIATGSPTAHVSISKKSVKKLIKKALRNKRGPAGPTGPQGPAGPAGQDGATGPAGNPFATVYQDTWFTFASEEERLPDDGSIDGYSIYCQEGEIATNVSYATWDFTGDVSNPDEVEDSSFYEASDDVLVTAVISSYEADGEGLDGFYGGVSGRNMDADPSGIDLIVDCTVGTYGNLAAAKKAKGRALPGNARAARR